MSSPTFTVQQVAKPTEAQVQDAARIFADLMPADPLAIALTGSNTTLLPELAQAMIRPIALQIGDMYVALDENGTMIGFSIKLPDEAKAHFAMTLGHDFPKVIDEFSGMENTERNCYWCNFNFVKAEYQGKGVARAMFQLVFQNARQNGYTMALATTNARNVIIYEHLGFQMKGFREMPSPWGSWPAWIFVRKP